MSSTNTPEFSGITNSSIHRTRFDNRSLGLQFWEDPSKVESSNFPNGCTSANVTGYDNDDDGRPLQRLYGMWKTYSALVLDKRHEEVGRVFIPHDASKNESFFMSDNWQIFKCTNGTNGTMEAYQPTQKDKRRMKDYIHFCREDPEGCYGLTECPLANQFKEATQIKFTNHKCSLLKNLNPPNEDGETVKYILIEHHEWPSDVKSIQQFQGPADYYISQVPDSENALRIGKARKWLKSGIHSARESAASGSH